MKFSLSKLEFSKNWLVCLDEDNLETLSGFKDTTNCKNYPFSSNSKLVCFHFIYLLGVLVISFSIVWVLGGSNDVGNSLY